MLPRLFQEIEALNECTDDRVRGPPITVKPHEKSRSDRMQRHRMEREIIDCNMITWVMMMAKMEGLKGSSMPLLAAAVGWVMPLWRRWRRACDVAFSQTSYLRWCREAGDMQPLVQRRADNGGEHQLIKLPL